MVLGIVTALCRKCIRICVNISKLSIINIRDQLGMLQRGCKHCVIFEVADAVAVTATTTAFSVVCSVGFWFHS